MKLAVIGDPVAHSKSPQIHAAFLHAAGIEGTYEAIRVPAGGVRAALDRLRAEGYLGINVTTPLKEEAFALCAVLDEIARNSGSVNTMTLLPEGVAGANTDGAGSLEAVREATGTDAHGKRILLLGVGPTARAAAFALHARGAQVLIWNRTRARARELVQRLDLAQWEPGSPVDVALSTLPPDAELEPLLVHALRGTPVVIDANYGPRATLAAALGRPTVDGEHWLLAQARASFDIWCAHNERA
jgi:shikimate dehydrogenase